ncbi:M23 family metallopeptidase [Streptomyces sp. AJS327]|uniref:M23 family metallopeptidase n=1 Tax=Streptomyces sp. AJS327 TaxID=2545265 RepID=UPI0015DFB010|nr:M23 family metallopeptidase [Streptomyces sp. AJS327]MBA0053830.1 M23 family metallopeptidase [Streptomyces sp. AJS327]
MSKITTNRRTKAAVLASGFGLSVAVGTGVALAAGGDGGVDAFATGTAKQLAAATQGQSDQQNEAVDARKQAKERAAEKKERADRAEKRKAKSWVSPISGDYELTASFGNSGDRWQSGHSGQDFGVPTGTPVKSVHKGTVVKAGGNGGGDGAAYGNAVVVKHNNGTYSQYAHLDSVKVSAGEQVKTGQEIGKSGNSGNSSGPHLHFELRTTPDYGSGKDPVPQLKDLGVKL